MHGLSFIHAGFLAAGLAVVVPIVIHLLFRQKARKVLIGSVQFLHRVVREHRRRRRVRQWLLLALRTLAVLLLAFLFARPFFDRSSQRGLQQELILLIDCSASMAAKDARESTAFERAAQAARDELARVDENVIVHVALCDAAGIREVSPKDFEKTARTTDAATDYGTALAWAHDVLAVSPRLDRRVVLITDLQRSGLDRTATDPLPDGAEFEVRDVGQAISQNVAMQAVDAIRTEIRPQEPVTLRIAVRNFGPLPVKNLSLQVRLDGPAGKVAADKTIDVAGSGRATVDVPLNVQTDGVYRGYVAMNASDDLAWDNRRWVGFEARHPDRLLLVDGQEGRTVFANETYYLETALRLRSAESGLLKRSFEVERMVWETGQGFPSLAGFRLIVLTNVRRLSADDVERLNTYVRAGGSLLIFAGDQMQPAGLDALHDVGIFPGIIAREPVAAKLRISSWDTEHAALAPFADSQRGDLRRIEFAKSVPLEKLAPDSRALLRAGDQVIGAERIAGAGRCIYFGSTADREWTDWPQSRLYVPLVRQLAAYLTSQLSDRAAVVTELVTKPDQQAGVTEASGRIVVRNIDPQESVPDRVTVEELYRSLGILPAELSPEEQARRASLALPQNAERPNETWTTILWGLFVVLIAETFLASRVHA